MQVHIFVCVCSEVFRRMLALIHIIIFISWIISIPWRYDNAYSLIRCHMKILLKSHIWTHSWIKYQKYFPNKFTNFPFNFRSIWYDAWNAVHFHYFNINNFGMHASVILSYSVQCTKWKYLHRFLNTVS